LISFENEKINIRINIHYTTGTVGIYLNHSRNGRTQYFHRYVTYNDLIEIFKNPRTTTGTGYFKTTDWSYFTNNNYKKKARRLYNNIYKNLINFEVINVVGIPFVTTLHKSPYCTSYIITYL
jgi:hypothetical protein